MTRRPRWSKHAGRFRRYPQARRLSLELLEDRALLAGVNWDGGGDGVSWDDPINWDTDTLPGINDDVVIDAPDEITVTHSAGTSTVNSLLSAEAIVLSGGTLAVTSTVQVDNTLTLDGGTLANATVLPGNGGTITATGNFNNRLSGVTLDGDVDLAAANALLRLSDNVTINGTLTVSGSNARLSSDTTQTIGGSGTIRFAGTSGTDRRLLVEGGTTLTLGENLTVRGGRARIGDTFFVSGNSSVTNLGTIVADVPGQTLRIDPAGTGTFTNEGVITGNSTLAGDIINRGIVQPGLDIGTLTIDGNYGSPQKKCYTDIDWDS